MGRPHKPYKTSWGEYVPGLSRRSDGRWRVVATGELWTEQDEYSAVNRYKQRYAETRPTVFIPVARGEPSDNALIGDQLPLGTHLHQIDHGEDDNEIGQVVDERAAWEWVRQQIIEKPDYAAQMLRIPQIATLASLAIPGTSLTIKAVEECYIKHNPAQPYSKTAALVPFRRLVKFCHAKTIGDFTTEKLISFKAEIENDPNLKSGGTKKSMFRRIRTVLGFGLKMGLDASQIRAALDRAKVLWTAAPTPPPDPHPISREDFRKLLDAAVGRNAGWRPWLLLSMNLCLHMGDCCALKWDTFDLVKGTYAAIRNKTRADRVPQAAVLWPETLEALKTLPRSSPYVLISSHGTRYSRRPRSNMFADFRRNAGVSVDVKWDDIRDGSYTTAINAPEVEERFARVLAGHKSPGLQDQYVLRNPSVTATACDAVHKAYMA